MPVSEFRLVVACTPQALWDFHTAEGALQQLTMPNSGVKVLRHQWPLGPGTESLLSVPVLPGLRLGWLAKITLFSPPTCFIDEQMEGPFRSWVHEHRISSDENGQAVLVDCIRWRLHWWQALGGGHWWVRRQLRQVFAYRHQVTAAALESGGSR